MAPVPAAGGSLKDASEWLERCRRFRDESYQRLDDALRELRLGQVTGWCRLAAYGRLQPSRQFIRHSLAKTDDVAAARTTEEEARRGMCVRVVCVQHPSPAVVGIENVRPDAHQVAVIHVNHVSKGISLGISLHSAPRSAFVPPDRWFRDTRARSPRSHLVRLGSAASRRHW